MTNIVERLRGCVKEWELGLEAADEIERLRAERDALRADAEALRLAVKLRLHVGIYDRDEDGRRCAVVSKWSARVQFRESLGDDECAAVRRAIGKVVNAMASSPMAQGRLS